MRIANDCLVDRGLRENQYKNHNVYSFFCAHNTAYLAPLCIVLAAISTLNSTSGREAVYQAITSYLKGV